MQVSFFAKGCIPDRLIEQKSNTNSIFEVQFMQ